MRLDGAQMNRLLASRDSTEVKSKLSVRRKAIAKSGYRREQDLRDEFAASLKHEDRCFGSLVTALEFAHASGRTDLIAESSNGELIAFETKLVDWRRAVQQAYRNSSFAHYSYVVLPLGAAKKAPPVEFTKRKIGLCYIRAGQITVEIEAPKQDPLQPWITDSALAVLATLTVYARRPPRRHRT